MFDTALCWHLLRNWAQAAEAFWYALPGTKNLGCYGTGYDAWGVQTNQKYLATMASLAAHDQDDRALDRALSALRFSFYSHVTGAGCGTDGRSWGCTWISALGIERMMHAMPLLQPHLTVEDQNALRCMLIAEADWLADHHARDMDEGMLAGKWGNSGKNHPESNIWNGSLLWRTACLYPDHAHVEKWKERAHQFLINGVSIEADATDNRIVAGRPIRDRHMGANFFDHYALDHHGYFNVGYMLICVSNAAMLHFDMKAAGIQTPESLYHHQVDLWQALRRMIFSDGRLARLGGDSRLRYTYCQEYLLPSLLFAADALGERHAMPLIAGQLRFIQDEAKLSRDGTFYGGRLSELAAGNPLYFTRLESDRACTLSMLLTYAQLVDEAHIDLASTEEFEQSVAGDWTEPEYGGALHRSPTRLASFAWQAYGYTQGLCVPPTDGHLAEWNQNLAGQILFVGDDGTFAGGQSPHRELVRHYTTTFEGGFATTGTVTEGIKIAMNEAWMSTALAEHHLAFVALPDGHTVIGLQQCRVLDGRAYTICIKGMNLGIANDVFNGFRRHWITAEKKHVLLSPVETSQSIPLGSRWACVDDCLGAVGIYGADEMAMSRSPQRRGGQYHSLYVDELCWSLQEELTSHDPGAMVLDVGWAALASVDADDTQRFSESCQAIELSGLLRAVCVTGLDDKRYTVFANFGKDEVEIPIAQWIQDSARRLNNDTTRSTSETITIAARTIDVWVT